jgi:7-carboxy-7-deazaguanine synthase
MADALKVNEIYLSLQGESTFAGLPCIFVRLSGCNLRCSYCDSAYAFTEGEKRSADEIMAGVEKLARGFGGTVGGHRLPLIEFTGGEPLLQSLCLPLMKALCDRGYTVLVETSGAIDVSGVDPRVRKIMDLKCPSSGESDRNRWQNLRHLTATDEIKFVIGTLEDYEWAKQQIQRHSLASTCPLLFSWVQPLEPHQKDPTLKSVPSGQSAITRQQLAEAIIRDALPVRFQAQLHKIIWPPDRRGV